MQPSLHSRLKKNAFGLLALAVLFPPAVSWGAAAPVITSALSESGIIGTPFSYTITATDSPSSYSALPLPGGLTLNGATISGTPTGGGVFNVTISASNSLGTGTADLTLTFTESDGSFGSFSLKDSDGDGFPDFLEKTLGTDPLDAKSTPLGGAPAGSNPISSAKLSFKLSFVKADSDSISFSGSVDVPAGTVTDGKTFIVDVGGVIAQIVLNSKGSGSNNGIKAKVSIKGTTAKFTIKGSKGSYAQLLDDEGLTSVPAKKKGVMVPAIIIFNNAAYKAVVAQTYTTAGKTGTSK